VTFDDVAGIDEAKEEARGDRRLPDGPEQVPAARRQDPEGVLLVGPAGHRQDAARARRRRRSRTCRSSSISGSDFVEMFVGVGASRVRDMFEQAKKNAPCIIFIDEIDAVGRHRGAGLGGGNDEREQTLNQLLVEMDGFEANEGVILIAATNRPDVLDPALLRPGRFDRQVVVPTVRTSTAASRSSRCTCARCRSATDVDLETSSRAARRASPAPTSRTSSTRRPSSPPGAASASVDMARLRGRQGQGHDGRRAQVHGHDARKKRLTAYHEAGHAIVGRMVAEARPGPQGDDHSARPCAGRDLVAAGGVIA